MKNALVISKELATINNKYNNSIGWWLEREFFHSSEILGARKYLRTPRLSILNSTTRGCSWCKQRRVKLEIAAALLNMLR